MLTGGCEKRLDLGTCRDHSAGPLSGDMKRGRRAGQAQCAGHRLSGGDLGQKIAEETIAGSGGVDHINLKGRLVDAAGLAAIVRAVAATGDHQMRNAGLGRRGAEHGRQRLRLAFIDDQKIGMRQQGGGHFGVKGSSAIGQFQPTLPRRRNKIAAAIGLVLKKRPVTLASSIKRGARGIHINVVIGPGEQQDLVFAIGRYRHNRMAGGQRAVLDAGQFHPGAAHLGAKPFILWIGGADMAHVPAGTGQCDRLVGAFAAKGALVIKRCQRFARRREMRHQIDKVDVDRAEIEDSHSGSPMEERCLRPYLQGRAWKIAPVRTLGQSRTSSRTFHPFRPQSRALMSTPKRPRKMKLADIETCFQRLAERLPDPKTELTYTSPYTLLVAVVLSAQATDVGVNRATKGLFAAAATPQAMVALGVDGIAHHIRTIGLFNTKAKNVHRLSEILIEEHDGVVPDDRDALEALPGVGRKTANVVLNEWFGQPTIAVDTHIFRVGNRTGMAPGKTPDAVEAELVRRVPEAWKKGAHHWLILHGRYVCKARKPDCGSCTIAELCLFRDKVFS